MKLYISADIEGVCGVTSWSETELQHRDSLPFIKQWEKEINAVIESAIEVGYDEIYVKDAHDSARNLLPEFFRKKVRLIRGWSGHPYSMVEGLDDSFDAVVFIGFHSEANAVTSTLPHTLNPSIVREIRINGQRASEFLIYYYTALHAKVPVVLVTGDDGICEIAKKQDKDITTVCTKRALGGATINENPVDVIENIKKNTLEALKSKMKAKSLPKNFEIEFTFRKHEQAYRASFYKGVQLKEDGYTIMYSASDYFDILRLLAFTAF